MRRMVLVALGRSGSELLADALRQHPLIEVHGEVFIDKEQVRREAIPVGGTWWRSHEDGATFLRETLFVDRGRPIIGLKLMVTHAQSGPGSTAWDYLAQETVDVVWLTRENLLEALVSREVADRLQRWHIRVGQPIPEVPPFRIEPEAAERYFRRITSLTRLARERLAAQRSMTLEYQRDLVERFGGAVEQVFQFLGVETAAVRPSYVKQARRPVSAQLENWEQLAGYFAGSDWGRWFS